MTIWYYNVALSPYEAPLRDLMATNSDDNFIPTPHTPHQQHVEMGQGCSRRQSQALLTYARTLGPEGEELPTQYYQLWNAVAKDSATDRHTPFCGFNTP